MSNASTRDGYRAAHRLRVRYSEIDAQGVVFNAHYLTYFDTAITEALRPIGWDWTAELARTGCDFHLVKSLVEYRKPVRFDDEIDVCVRPGRIGTSSLTWELAVFCGGSCCATGEIVWVYTDLKAERAVPLPEAMKHWIESNLV